jgi:hypothetical protein
VTTKGTTMTTTTETARDPYELAKDAIPGFRKVEAAHDAVQQRLAELRAPKQQPAADLVGEACAAAMAGEPVPDDLGRRAWEAQKAQEFAQAEMQVLIGAETRLRSKRAVVLDNGAAEGLPVLRAALDELLAEAYPAAEALRGVRDAQTAIDRGPKAVDAWQGFDAYVSRYARIRKAQDALTQAAMGESVTIEHRYVEFHGVFNVWAEIANVTEVWPEWMPARADGDTLTPPWPVLYVQRPFEVRHDREWLLWALSTPGVKLWLPGVDELKKAYTEQLQDARARAGKAPKPKSRSGEPRRVPTHYSDGAGGVFTEFAKIEG